MATNSNATTLPYDPADIITRGLKRTLPCKMDDVELLKLALQRADKAALRLQVVADFDKLKAKHKAQLEEMDGEIAKADREIHAREQDRVVICTSVFHRDASGSGFVHFYRNDTDTIIEERPASVAEAQRYLPGVEGDTPRGGPILDRAPALHVVDEDDGTAGAPDDDVTDIDDMARQAEEEDAIADGDAKPAKRGRKGGGK